MSKKQKKLLLRILIAAVLFAAVFAVEKLTQINRLFYLIMYLVPYLIVGYDVLVRSVKNIARGQLFDESFLMSIATVVALVIGEYPESVFVMLFYQTGELFQSIAVEKSRRSISELMDIAPVSARVIRDGDETEVDPEEVVKGDVLVIRPGEKIPVDAIVIDGSSAVDASALTGESAPEDVIPGSRLVSGCVNLTGVLRCEALCEYEDSSVAKILELVEKSSMNKAKSENFITKFAKYYTPAVVVAAVLLALIPSIITKNPSEWIYRALIFLVVSCPCAVVISVPLAYFAGIGSASTKGLLIKGGNFLEALANVKTAVFDKTGTLTHGSFTVTEVLPAEGLTEQRLLALAAGAEYYSNHPLAVSIRNAAKNIRLTSPDNVTEVAGQGIIAEFSGNRVLAGNAVLLRNEGIDFVAQKDDATFVYIAAGDKYAGVIKLEDAPKSEAGEAVSALKKLGVKKTVMLTGDRRMSAQKVADSVGIDEVYYSLMPQDKTAKLSELIEKSKKHEKLFYVGDGINDAPVLSLAHVGIAMGALGSDAAIEAADAVIMDDDVKKLVDLVKTAKKTHRIVTENVVFALAVKFAVLILAAFGFTNMWGGALADVGVAMLCILNSMRMLIKKD
ncbi:MAG: cadmium-translocating P-type ATPase [Clostridia bacterium]|nr:cadmium-translocating P-type ATPase [Clostridia bacterium]